VFAKEGVDNGHVTVSLHPRIFVHILLIKIELTEDLKSIIICLPIAAAS
jgi:hypothetical protein